jgi:beta-lactamase class A
MSQTAAARLTRLDQRIDEIQRKSGSEVIAVAVRDLETGLEYGRHADRWFHAASTIKIAILLGVYHGLHTGELVHHSRVHVRNRFLSAHDGEPFRVSADRDANSAVHAAIGKTMRIEELASHMIVTSSNLATNLLLDLVGLEHVQNVLLELGIEGVDVRRGVEDERAYEHGIVNRVTANGLVDLLRLIAEERAFSAELSREMLEVLYDQEFNGGIPARLPKGVRVAHKTGDISTVAHDAGIVYAPDRKPYILSVLSEWPPEVSKRSSTIAAVSYAVYEYLTEEAGSEP